MLALGWMLLTGCASGPQLGRLGQPVPLPNGQPRSVCERQGWYEVVPTRVKTETVRGLGYGRTYYSELHEGLGVYRVRGEDPEDLDDVWPKLREPELQRRHEARIQPVDDAVTRGWWWLIGGTVGLAGGVGTAAAIEKQSPTGAAVAGVSGLAIGLVGVIGALASLPSASAEMDADARRKLFFAGEDDVGAVSRGVDASNGRTRLRCGGR